MMAFSFVRVLVAVCLLPAVVTAKIRRVEVRAVGTKPVFGGLLATKAAGKLVGKNAKQATKKGPRTALAADAAKWFGSRGYVVDNVGVRVEPERTKGAGDTVVLSAAVLPCGAVRLRSNSTKKVGTRPATVARKLGLRMNRPFKWDVSRLAALTEPDTGLFHRDGTTAKAVVENGRVVVDMVVAEQSFVALTPEVEIDADRARLFLRVSDRNVSASRKSFRRGPAPRLL